jgi:3'-phosphoadenosine 5'-phosphosulfate sulfotransferase (PAPS reductase)/FAD synthetase
LPIHDWTEEQVWQRIRASGVPYHPACDQGMTRLSCSLCVLASRADLVRAA